MTTNKTNKQNKHKHNDNNLRGLRWAISVISYHIVNHIRGICTSLGWGLLALGLIILHADFYAFVSMWGIGAVLICCRFALGDKK